MGLKLSHPFVIYSLWLNLIYEYFAPKISDFFLTCVKTFRLAKSRFFSSFFYTYSKFFFYCSCISLFFAFLFFSLKNYHFFRAYQQTRSYFIGEKKLFKKTKQTVQYWYCATLELPFCFPFMTLLYRWNVAPLLRLSITSYMICDLISTPRWKENFQGWLPPNLNKSFFFTPNSIPKISYEMLSHCNGFTFF